MGILGNNLVRNLGVHRGLGDVFARTPGNYAMYSFFSNTRSHAGDTTVHAGNAIPAGSYYPDTFFMPQEAGEMSIRATASGALSAYLYPSQSMSIDLTGTGDLNATAALVISMFLDLVGSGDLSAYIVGNLNMSIDMTGSGDLSAQMEGIADMLIALTGQGTLEATIAAYGNMSIDIVVTGTGLTTSNVGQAVWSALASLNNEPASMGEKLNDAGSAANPWTENLPGTYTGNQAGKVIADIKSNIDAMGVILDSVSSLTISNSTKIAIIEKLTGNKVTKSGDIITIYEADGTTIWRQYNLASGGRVQV